MRSLNCFKWAIICALLAPVGLARGATPSDEQLRKVFANELGYVQKGHIAGLAIVELTVSEIRQAKYCRLKMRGCGLNPSCSHGGKRTVTVADFTVGDVAIREGAVKPPASVTGHALYSPQTPPLAKGDKVWGAISADKRGGTRLMRLQRITAQAAPVGTPDPALATAKKAYEAGLTRAKADHDAAVAEARQDYLAKLHRMLKQAGSDAGKRQPVEAEIRRIDPDAKLPAPGEVDDKVRRITLKNASGVAGLRRINKHTHIYSFSNEQAWIQFSFESRPFDAKDPLASIRKRFKYANIEVRFPEKTAGNSRTYTQLRGPLRDMGTAKDFSNMKGVKLTVTSFKDNRLRGRFEGTITQLTVQSRGPGLRSGDIAGIGHTSEKANIPFVIDFDLSVDSPD